MDEEEKKDPPTTTSVLQHKSLEEKPTASQPSVETTGAAAEVKLVDTVKEQI